jgi:hypothetical protein
MTQKEFASQLLQVVDNSREFGNKSDAEIIESLNIFLSVLEPKNRIIFSRWGHKSAQVSEEECWDK